MTGTVAEKDFLALFKHVPKSVISRFSKRHEQIDTEAQRQAAKGYGGDPGELRTRVAHEHRRRKIKNSTADELRSHWGKQLSHDEQRVITTRELYASRHFARRRDHR